MPAYNYMYYISIVILRWFKVTSKCEASKFPWPKEVTELMDNVFALMGIVPSLASLDFSAQCHGEQLAGEAAKLVAPGVYFVVSPLIAMCGVLLLCGLVAYVMVPVARRMGIDFNEMAKKRKKREAIALKCRSKAF